MSTYIWKGTKVPYVLNMSAIIKPNLQGYADWLTGIWTQGLNYKGRKFKMLFYTYLFFNLVFF